VKKTTFFVLGIIFLLLAFKPVFANSPPKFINTYLSPHIASPGEEITFGVCYQGKEPEYVRIYFYDGPHEMNKTEKRCGDSGVIYEYRRLATAEEGGLEYYFEASDGKNKIRFPDYEGGGVSVDVLDEAVDNNAVYLFSSDSRLIWTFDTGKDWVQKVAISQDGQYIAVKTNDFIYLFSRNSNQPLWKYQCMPDLGENKESFAGWVDISSDGNFIAGGCQSSLNLFSKDSNKPLWSYMASVYTVSISSSGEYIALGTFGGESNHAKGDSVFLFKKESNKPLWQYKSEGNIHALSISSDGNFVAAGDHCPSRRAFLFSKESNKPLFSYVTSKGSPVWTSAISSDGKYIVYGLDGSDGFNNLFFFSSDKKEPLWAYPAKGWIRSVAISDNGKYLVAGSGEGHYVYLFDRNSAQPIWKYQAQNKVGCVDISANGDYFVAGSKDKKIYFFSKKDHHPLWSYQAKEWINTVAISADGNYLVAGTGAQQYLGEIHSTLVKKPGNGKEKPTVCGDTICEREKGESYENCPQDCVSEKGDGDILETSKRRGNLWIIMPFGAFILTIVIAMLILRLRNKMLNKKILWTILFAFLCFDPIFSYIAITKFNLREGYPLSAYFVHEISPLFYFVFIPVSMAVMYLLVKATGWLALKTEKNPKPDTREISETIALTSIVVAWGIGITSANLFVLINGMKPVLAGEIWRYWMTVGVLLGVACALYESHKLEKKQ